MFILLLDSNDHHQFYNAEVHVSNPHPPGKKGYKNIILYQFNTNQKATCVCTENYILLINYEFMRKVCLFLSKKTNK